MVEMIQGLILSAKQFENQAAELQDALLEDLKNGDLPDTRPLTES